MRKHLLTCFLFSMLIIATWVASSDASVSDKPSTPEFSATFVGCGYDAPPTYEIDQSTGEKILIQQGYHVENNSVVFKIKNQPYPPTNGENDVTKLYYTFRFKGHYSSEWTCYYPFNGSGYNARYLVEYNQVAVDDFPIFEASKGNYSELAVNLAKAIFPPPPEGGLIDIQVQAQTGVIQPLGDGLYKFTGESSDWSPTQTAVISGTTYSLTPSATPPLTPTPSISPSINQNGIQIYSNSTITFFSVNNTSSEVNFIVSGPTGTTGCTQIIIAKSFMPNSNIKVYLDGNETSHQLEEKEDSWAIIFTYQHSEHQVTISASNNIANSEHPEWIWTITIIAVAFGLASAGGIIVWMIRKKPQSTVFSY